MNITSSYSHSIVWISSSSSSSSSSSLTLLICWLFNVISIVCIGWGSSYRSLNQPMTTTCNRYMAVHLWSPSEAVSDQDHVSHQSLWMLGRTVLMESSALAFIRYSFFNCLALLKFELYLVLPHVSFNYLHVCVMSSMCILQSVRKNLPSQVSSSYSGDPPSTHRALRRWSASRLEWKSWRAST